MRQLGKVCSIVVILILVLIPMKVNAQVWDSTEVIVIWDKGGYSQDIVFKVYWDTTYLFQDSNFVWCNNNYCKLYLEGGRQYYFAATAYDKVNKTESKFSDIITTYLPYSYKSDFNIDGKVNILDMVRFDEQFGTIYRRNYEEAIDYLVTFICAMH